MPFRPPGFLHLVAVPGANLPFSPSQFFQVFAACNQSVWPAQCVLLLLADGDHTWLKQRFPTLIVLMGTPEHLSARQRRHINDDPVFHFISQHPLIGLVDRLHVDDFHIGRNTVLAAEVEHFLGFWQPADH